jgi:beta-galactosidase
MRYRIWALIIASTLVKISTAQLRTEYSINDHWKFYGGDIAFAQRSNIKEYPTNVDATWEEVSIPHTWNASDPFDDQESYRRGISWYRKSLVLSADLKEKNIYLFFEGVNQVADVYVNGAFAGNHKGGYTAFTIDITKLVSFEKENVIAVKVNSSHDNFIPPLSVGYALYGGIYRDVKLIATNKVHFDMTNYGSKGVFVATPNLSENKSDIAINGLVINESANKMDVIIKHIVFDAANKPITQTETIAGINPGQKNSFSAELMEIQKPKLWSPEMPYLYTVKSQLIVDGKVVDELVNPLGFRWFDFNPDTGFHLNGKKYLLKGTNRHQDMKGLGGALPNSQHLADLISIKEMGANFLRLAHYPQDPAVLAAADSLGLLIWEEIPVVNYVNCSDEFKQNAHVMLSEMIRQHFNHPSIILWGSCNEIFLWNGLGERASKITNEHYMKWTHDFVASLDSAIHAEDPTRFSTLAMHGSSDYDKCGITAIPDVLSINQYEGWYSGEFVTFGKNLDKRHEKYPNQVLFVSEYGAGSDSRINAMKPERFDFSGNWQRMFHESYYQQISARSWLAGSAMWNQYDFSQPHTGGTIQHINQKGVQTWDRKKKDAYYFYKANWTTEPMVYIASREWTQRNAMLQSKGVYDEKLPLQQVLDVYSNNDKVELFLNGKSLGTKKINSLHKATWYVEFAEGENKLLAKAGSRSNLVIDQLTIHFTNHSAKLQEGEELLVNLGFNAEFVDDENHTWLPDRKYTSNCYGSLNGDPVMANKDLIVLNADNKAVLYNYALEGVENYKIDVPDGWYAVELLFAETIHYQVGQRVFSVAINESDVFNDLDMFAQFGFLQAFSKTVKMKIENGEGITINFSAKTGKSLISAIKINRLPSN